MAMSKIKGLQQWCRKMAEGYPRVDITNFTTAWRDGLAFCAIIHRFRPDLIDFDSLSPENVFENCKMAFEIAQQELSIPAFLEAEDMVRLKVPDKLSIITYVSQYYNFLHALPQLGGPGVKGKVSNKTISGTKRPTDSDTSQAPITKKASTTEAKENMSPATERPTAGGDKCGICQNRVYLLERHMEGGKLYHRSCFRHSELSPANKVYNRSPFLSPSLSSDTQSITSLSSDNKSKVLSGVGKDNNKVLNLKRQTEIEPVKATSEAASISRKSEGVALKHTLDEPGREDTKKSKMQPRILFDVEKSKKATASKDKSDVTAEYPNNKSNESNKFLPLSSSEARKLERRQEEIMQSEKAVEDRSKSSKLNMPIIFQNNKPTSDASKNISTVLAPTAVTVTTLKTVTPAAETRAKSNILEAKSSAVSVTASKTSNAALPFQSNSEIVQSNYKLTCTKDSQKPSDEKKPDTVSLKTNILPGVQNLQKMFSGKSSLDFDESSKPAHPVPRPRSGTLKSVSEESSTDTVATRSAIRTSAEDKSKDMTPKPTPRKSMEISEKTFVPKQPDLSNGELKTRTSAPPLPKSFPPPLPSSVPSGEVVSFQTDKNVKKPSAERTLQEAKASLHPAKHPEDPRSISNASNNLNHKGDSSRITTQDNTKMKPTNEGSNLHISTPAKEKQQTEAGSAAMAGTTFTSKLSNQKSSTDKEQNGANFLPSKKESGGTVLTGLLTSLAGIRDQISSSPSSTNSTLLPPDKIPASTPSSQFKVKSETNFVSSSKTPINKTAHATSTPSALSLHSVSQTDTKKSVVNTYKVQSTSNTERTIGIHGQKDSAVSLKVINSTTTSQTPSKVQEGLGTFSFMKPASGTTTVTPMHQSTIDSKQTRPDKINSGLSTPAQSQHVDAHGKETSKLSHNINQNRYAKSGSSNLLNSKDSEKKLENRDAKSDSKQSTFQTPISRSVSIDEAKSLSSIKTKSISSSREDLLDINSVKLKRVMPEQKEAQKVTKAAVYDVKLKKVEGIKGDTKWDIGPQKPLRSLNILGTCDVDRNVGSVNGEKIVSSVSGNKSAGPSGEGLIQKSSVFSAREPYSSVATSQKTRVSDEMPQWKKDAEERNKKLQENRTHEPETNQLKHIKRNDDKTSAIKSDNKLGIVNKEKAPETQNVLKGALAHPSKPGETASLERESMKSIGSQKIGRKISPTRENHGNSNKLDWQIEAEKRMAAIAGFDKEVAGKLKDDKVNVLSSDSPINQQTKENRSTDLSNFSDSKTHHLRRHNGDIMVGDQGIVQNKGTPGIMFEKGTTKSKDLELEFTFNKTKMKPVGKDTIILQGREIETLNKDQDDKNLAKNGIGEDFRNILFQLKHVAAADSGKMDVVKNDIRTDLHGDNTTFDRPPSAVTKPLQNNNVNLNNNNKPVVSEQSHISVVEDSQKLNKNSHMPAKTFGLEGLADENGNDKKNLISEPPEEKLVKEKKVKREDKKDEKTVHTSPKVKKITALDNNKITVMSPPSSPKHKKKIQVTRKFDFEKSSDFEQSLMESTAKLTIKEKFTPPARPSPSDSNHEGTSPHISAIELQQQLRNIDSRLAELELRGRQLEDCIRGVISMEEDDDKLMIEWFSLINEKNDLVRKEADLVYISREQELESEQEQIESQLRYLISKPDECKSPEEKLEEDYLIKRKVELVEQRNMIIDSMDEDRVRYEHEDKGIEVILKDKGYWKDSTGTLKALKGKKVARSVFYT